MLTLEQIGSLYNVPTELDGIRLSQKQALFLARSLHRLVTEAEHPFETALEISLRVFRASFRVENGVWANVENIFLGSRSKILRHNFLREVE